MGWENQKKNAIDIGIYCCQSLASQTPTERCLSFWYHLDWSSTRKTVVVAFSSAVTFLGSIRRDYTVWFRPLFVHYEMYLPTQWSFLPTFLYQTQAPLLTNQPNLVTLNMDCTFKSPQKLFIMCMKPDSTPDQWFEILEKWSMAITVYKSPWQL